MDDDGKQILLFTGGCALIGVLSFVAAVWGLVAAIRWALS